VIRRDEGIRNTALALLVIIAAGAVLISHRPLWPTVLPRVAHVADLPERVDRREIDRFIDFGIIMPKVEHPPILAFAAEAERAARVEINQQPRLGYSYREIDFFGLPLLAYPEFGYVLYRERDRHFSLMPLGPDGLDLLERRVGTRLERGYVFPFWNGCWGLFLVIAGAGIWLFELGARRRKRAVLGLI